MRRVEVWHIVDDTVRVDELDGEQVNAKILPGGRGYVKVPGDERLYGRVEYIRITDDGGARRVRHGDVLCPRCGVEVVREVAEERAERGAS